MKKVRSIIAVLMAVMMVVGSVPTNAFAAKQKSTVKSVTITSPTTTNLVLSAKKTYQVKTKVVVTGSASKRVSYYSSNKKVATVSSTGKIKALKKGTTYITVKSRYNSKIKDTVKVTVGTPVTKITLNKTKATVYVGSKVTLKATISPKTASIKKVTYSSNKTSVATVSSKGVVTCKKAGTAVITVKATDGSNKKATCTIVVKKKSTSTPKPSTKPSATPKPSTQPSATPVPGKDLSYKDYDLKWKDDFSESTLNKDDWNIELHEPGWVNAELQQYTDSSKNIYLKDGNLVLKPIKTKNADGTYSYTSGRVNTQNKHDFTYGMFEVRAKVPAGKGYLPAFWMMPTNESLYGQWPRCGELDVMEVKGDATNTAYGTIHYGEPHNQKQGTYVLDKGNFADEYHTYTCEWEPGKIIWYIDGNKYYETDDWFTATNNQGEVTYPAPFDQPFYMILNLAVGGSWVGYPDENTQFDNQAFVIDYVKAYQKESYNDKVEKPEKEVVLRDPDESGNYINNGDFSTVEDLNDDKDWKFLLTQGGEATATIEDNAMYIASTKAGDVDYSVQLVQPNLPMKKGGQYKLTFDAYSIDEARTMKVDISGPDNNYIRYLQDTNVALTTKKQSYEYTFTMMDNDDANGRLEYNLGATSSTAGVVICNVRLEKTGQTEIQEDDTKHALADGNYVYNGGFQEGPERLGYWDVKYNGNSTVSVTNTNTVRRLKVNAKNCKTTDAITVGQKDLALVANTNYVFSFDAQGVAGKELVATVAGVDYTAVLTADSKNYQFKFTTPDTLPNKDIVFHLGINGITYLDNVRIVEDSLIKNGSFAADFAGYEVFANKADMMSSVVDSQKEDHAASFNIKSVGDQAWELQLKQNNVELVKGQWYKLTLDAKSSVDREIMFAIQRDGSADDDWTPYSGEKHINLTNTYQTFDIEFQMKNETDLKSILSISMGKMGTTPITTPHTVCIDNITLEKIEAPKVDETVEYGKELLNNANFEKGITGWESSITAPGAADVNVANNEVAYKITNVGTADWNVQLKQNTLKLVKGTKYKLTFNATSTESRTIKAAFLSSTYVWYGGADIALTKDAKTPVTVEFTMGEKTDTSASLVISMGIIEGVATPTSTVTLSDFSLVAVE